MMTMRQIAELAHVSVSTVSKAFAGAPDISSQTREHILRIAEENGCLGKYSKSGYAKKVIAVICPEIGSQHYAVMAEKLQAALEKAGHLMVLGIDGFDARRQDELLDYFISFNRISGAVLLDSLPHTKKGYDAPVVALGSSSPAVDAIALDMMPPISAAVGKLKELGHTRIAFLGETLTLTKERLFREAMRRHRLAVDETLVFTESERFENAGYAAAKKLTEIDIPCTALVCAYDYIALGAIKYLQERGLRVPEDYSVIGMDNIRLDGYLAQSLSSIDVHADEQIALAIDLLDRKMANRWYTARTQTVLSGEFILRDSVGVARQITADAEKC